MIVSRIETAGQIPYHTSAGIPGSRTESVSAVNNEGTAEAVPTHRPRIGCQDNGLRKRQRRSRSRDPTMCPTAVVGPRNGRDNPSRYRRYAQRQCRWQGSRSSPWRRASLAARDASSLQIPAFSRKISTVLMIGQDTRGAVLSSTLAAARMTTISLWIAQVGGWSSSGATARGMIHPLERSSYRWKT